MRAILDLLVLDPIQIIEDDKECSKCNKENIKMNKNLKSIFLTMNEIKK